MIDVQISSVESLLDSCETKIDEMNNKLLEKSSCQNEIDELFIEIEQQINMAEEELVNSGDIDPLIVEFRFAKEKYSKLYRDYQDIKRANANIDVGQDGAFDINLLEQNQGIEKAIDLANEIENTGINNYQNLVNQTNRMEMLKNNASNIDSYLDTGAHQFRMLKSSKWRQWCCRMALLFIVTSCVIACLVTKFI